MEQKRELTKRMTQHMDKPKRDYKDLKADIERMKSMQDLENTR